MEKIKTEIEFYKKENRLKTFTDWPFTEDCACTPEKLAEAGFVYRGSTKEPDLVTCFVCFKELASWEPEDDPWKEHVDHAGHCPFIKAKDPENITVSEFILMEKSRTAKILEEIIRKDNESWNDLEIEIQSKIEEMKKKKL